MCAYMYCKHACSADTADHYSACMQMKESKTFGLYMHTYSMHVYICVWCECYMLCIQYIIHTMMQLVAKACMSG